MKKICFTILLSLLLVSLFAAFGQNKVQLEKERWSKLESMHFDIYYPEGEDDFGQTALLTAEEAYYYLKKDFVRPIIGRIPIIVYKSHSAFQTTNVINALLSQGIAGFTESQRNRVVLPFDGDYKNFEEVLTHELVHAYVNNFQQRYNSSRFFSSNTGYIPFWFSEGLPEYEAVGGRDSYNNMFIIDMIMNDYIYPLDNINGYYAYREGESFVSYISEQYGREKVMEYFHTIRSMSNVEKATKQMFGMSFKQLQNRWKTHLKKRYYKTIENIQIPYEHYEQLTNHIESNTYFNFFPAISPDGNRYLFLNNKNYRNSIWLGDIDGNKKPRLIIKGETSNKIEQFHVQRNNISWFSDNDRFAFAASSNKGDVIHIGSVNDKKIINTYTFNDFDAIYELSVSPDGENITFCGQRRMNTDIFVYNFVTDSLVNVTADKYTDMQPVYSHKGDRIAFTSYRNCHPDSIRQGLFTGLTKDVFIYNIESGTYLQVTDNGFNNSSPIWSGDDSKLLILSDRTGISNYDIVDLTTGDTSKLTNIFSGVFSGDISSDDSTILLSVFYNNGWDIYKGFNPIKNPVNSFSNDIKEISFNNDFDDCFNLDRYKLFGRTKRNLKEEFMHANHPGSTILAVKNVTKSDSLIKAHNDLIDAKPDSITIIPQKKSYKPKFLMDYLYGGGAYSSSDGALVFLETNLTDLMGNHTIGAMIGIAGDLEDSSIQLSYIYRPNRLDIGASVYYLSDETIYYNPRNDLYLREREHLAGTNIFIRYPFSRFWRFDAGMGFQKYDSIWNIGVDSVDDINWGDRIKEFEDDDYLFIPSFEIVHDNTLYGSTGPMTGSRSYYHVSKSFAVNNKNYLTQVFDTRHYFLFAKRFNISARVFGGWSTGDDPQTFSLDSWSGFSVGNSYGVRGYTNEELEGTKKALTSLELRVPFVDYVKFGFPLPLTLGDIRGSVYTDLGSVWDDTDNWRGMADGRFQDIIMGFGFGPRMNMGYFVLKLDVSWNTDLYNTDKPVYSFSISEDF